MKKIFLIFVLIFFTRYSIAQQVGIDGFVLGNSKYSTQQAVPNGFKLANEKDNWIRYSSDRLIYYTFYFDNGTLSKIVKEENSYNPSSFESMIGESYLNIAYEYGEPTMSGDSYAFWRDEMYKISFKYNVTTEQYRGIPTSLFEQPSMKTRHTLTIETTIESTLKVSKYSGNYIYQTTINKPTRGVSLRKEPDPNSYEIYRCPHEAIVYVIDNSDNYYKVYVNGYTGYVIKGFLKRQ